MGKTKNGFELEFHLVRQIIKQKTMCRKTYTNPEEVYDRD